MRFLTIIGLMALFACAAVNVSADEEEVVNRANPAAKVVAKMIGSLFAGAAASCLGEAASHCKDHWKHAHAAMQCARHFLAANKGRCTYG